MSETPNPETPPNLTRFVAESIQRAFAAYLEEEAPPKESLSTTVEILRSRILMWMMSAKEAEAGA
jgi:hypothetical protein